MPVEQLNELSHLDRLVVNVLFPFGKRPNVIEPFLQLKLSSNVNISLDLSRMPYRGTNLIDFYHHKIINITSVRFPEGLYEPDYLCLLSMMPNAIDLVENITSCNIIYCLDDHYIGSISWADIDTTSINASHLFFNKNTTCYIIGRIIESAPNLETIEIDGYGNGTKALCSSYALKYKNNVTSSKRLKKIIFKSLLVIYLKKRLYL